MNQSKDFIVGGVEFNAITIPKLFSQLTNKNIKSKGYITVSGVSKILVLKDYIGD